MSYTLQVFLADLDLVRGAAGSGKSDLVDAVLEYHPEPFRDEDCDGLSLRQALIELVAGELTDPESAHQYGYALRELCDYLGEDLGGWSDIRWAVMEESGLDQVLEQSGSPVPLPPNPGAFPAIGHLTGEQVKQALDIVRHRLPQTDDRTRPLLLDLQDWLDTAIQEERDLVFFYS